MLKKLLLTGLMCLPGIAKAENIDILEKISKIQSPIDYSNYINNINKINVDIDDYDTFDNSVNSLIDAYSEKTHYKFTQKEKSLILLTLFAQKESQHHCMVYKDNALKLSQDINNESPDTSKCIDKYNQNSFQDINSASYIINMTYIIKPLQSRANQNFIDDFVKKVVADRGKK